MSTKRRKILLIDDDHDNRVTLRLILEEHGYEVWTAANGRLALEMLEKQSLPDLVLLDMMMPLMDGEEFLKQVEVKHHLSSLPILILTSYREKLQKIGKKPVIMKPIDLESFAQQIENFFTKELP